MSYHCRPLQSSPSFIFLFLGKAIDFVVQNALSESYGGRPDASKVVIVIVSGKSEDTVETAALTARMNSKSRFTDIIFKQSCWFYLGSLLEQRVKNSGTGM